MHARYFATVPALAALLSIGPLPSVHAEAQGNSSCDVQAFTDDPDPSGTNVRSKPSIEGEVLATLPQSYLANGDAFSPELTLTDFQDGWFKVQQVRTGDYDGDGSKLLFDGPGWISAKLISLELEGQTLHQRPDMGSPTTFSLMDDSEEQASIQITEFHGCSGAFVEVSVQRADGLIGRGWTDDTCANQATTCS
jgi:hypothetical protein